MSQFAKLFLEPFAKQLFVYGQHQFAAIDRIFLYFEDIILDIKLTPAFSELNPTTAFSQLNMTIKDLRTILYNSQKPIDSSTKW